MKSRTSRFTWVLVALLTLGLALPTFGQVLKGSISGTVVDPQGAVVGGATVKATQADTGAVFTAKTEASGFFRLNLLPTGSYALEISAPGFKTATSKRVDVNAGSDNGLGAIKMTIGEASTTVEVTAGAPLVETSESQVSNTFSGTTLNTFAGTQENEGLDRMALFIPGVHTQRSQNFSNTNGTSFSTNGLRGRNNDQEIEGQNNNDNSVGGPGLFVSNPNFVQEYTVVTNNFSAEFGRNSGSVVNTILKSGTNAWHGSVYGNERNAFTEALSNTQRNTNFPGSPACADITQVCHPFTGPPRFNEEFTGFTIGGPMIKNKAFLFGGFDNDLFSGTSVYTTTSESPTPNGLVRLAACGGINATALGILQKFGPYGFSFGNPTPRNTRLTTVAGCTNTEMGGVTRIVPTPFHGFDFIIKNDLHFTNDTVASRYIFNRGNNFNGNDNGPGGWVNNVPALSQAVLESWTHTFSSRMVNEARIGFNRLNVVFGGGLNPLEPPSGQLLQAFTNITFQDGRLGIGPATNLPQSRLVNTWQFQDNWTYVLGHHNFKSGVNWSYQRSPNTFLPIVNGQYRFSSMNTFLTTFNPNRIQVANGIPVLDFREYDTFLYFGDDWKLKSNLTLNLGLTWTYYGSPENLFHDITTKREASSGRFWNPALDPSITTVPEIPSVKSSFGPGIGFAYQPQWGGWITGHGKTTLRGGYRLAYDPPFYNIFLNVSTATPMTFLQTLTGAAIAGHQLPANPIGPNVRADLASVLTPGVFDPRTFNETIDAPDLGPQRVHSWTFGFQRQFGSSMALEARYVGNHATDLFQTIDGNPYVGTATAPGQLQAFPAGLPPGVTAGCAASTQVLGPGQTNANRTDIGRLQCGNGIVRERSNTGFSDYNALQMEFRANNLFKQLTVRTSYTWSKNLDNVSEIFSTGNAGNTLFASQNPFQPRDPERSISGLDFPHVWALDLYEEVPFFREQKGFVGHALGGWNISGNYILTSGQGYTPINGGVFFLPAIQTATANFYDSAWASAFVGVDTARPFFGNPNAPDNTVGIYAGDSCLLFGAGCALPATQLLSFNAFNAPQTLGGTTPQLGCLRGTVNCNAVLVQITPNDVRYIVNARTAQSVFGTPFGNVPRNSARDAIANIANVTVGKKFKIGERMGFEAHLTMNNALNHFNFTSINPNTDNAGLNAGAASFGLPFADPSTTTATGRTVWVGGKFTF